MKSTSTIIGLIAGLFFSTTASASLIVSTDETAFTAAHPGLTVEDFEGGVVDENFSGPVNSTTTNIGASGSTIYAAGDIVPGVEFDSPRRADPPFTHEYNLRLKELAGSVAFSTPSSLNFLSIDFLVDVSAVSMDLYQLVPVTSTASDTTLRFFGSGGSSLGEVSITANDITPTFLGVVSDSDLITRIEVDDANSDRLVQTLENVPAIDNVAFGGAPSIPEPSSLLLFGVGVAGMGFARRYGRGQSVRFSPPRVISHPLADYLSVEHL